MPRYVVTCEVEVEVRADDEDQASMAAIDLLNSEADVASGTVLDVREECDGYCDSCTCVGKV